MRSLAKREDEYIDLHELVRWNSCTGEYNKLELPSMMHEDVDYSIPVTYRGRSVRTSWSLTQDRTVPQLVKFLHIPSNESFDLETDKVWVSSRLKNHHG